MSFISRNSFKTSRWMAVSAAVMGLSLGAGAANAAVVATANFNEDQGFVLGDIRNQTGGAGSWEGNSWLRQTTGPVTNVVDVSNNPLVYNVAGGGVIDGGNWALEFSGARGGHETSRFYRRDLNVGLTGDVFISSLYRVESMTTDIDEETGDVSYSPPWSYWMLGDNSRIGHSSSGEFLNRVASGATAPHGFGFTDMFVEPGETYLIVGRLWKSDPNGNYDRFDMWVNPAYSDLGTPHATGSHQTGQESVITSAGFNYYSADANYVGLWDALSIGTTWDSVVPVPEPSSLALVGLSGLLMLRRRRAVA